MKSIKVYLLWDHQDGYRIGKIYLDKQSAEIGLLEQYTDYWIKNHYAEIKESEAITYFNKEKSK